MSRCTFNKAWAGVCGKEDCTEHKDTKCCGCGKPATRSCPEASSLVCGAPVCDTCKHSERGKHE